MKQLIILSLAALTFTSCKYSEKTEVINVNNQFTMEVPEYLKKCDDLRPGAEFQYCNRYRNTYVVVFSDKKDKDFQTYYNEQIGIIKKVLNKPMVNDSTVIEIPGAKGVHTELAGKMQGEMIYYSVLTLETKDKSYQDCIWTRGEDRKLKYGKDLEKILLSFKLIQP
jgi:hypothetical protein